MGHLTQFDAYHGMVKSARLAHGKALFRNPFPT
jgi:hypothetical protein